MDGNTKSNIVSVMFFHTCITYNSAVLRTDTASSSSYFISLLSFIVILKIFGVVSYIYRYKTTTTITRICSPKLQARFPRRC